MRRLTIYLTLLLLLPNIAIRAETTDVPVYGSAPPASASKHDAPSTTQQKTLPPRNSGSQKAAARPLPPPSKTTLNLIEAIRAGNYEMAEILLREGGDINCRNCNYDGVPPLLALYDAERGHNPNRRLVWMLSHGANPNVSDKNGRTPLMALAGGYQLLTCAPNSA